MSPSHAAVEFSPSKTPSFIPQPRAAMASPARPAISKRACDACRRRKVKCDASAPVCANCRISLLSCQYKFRPRKRGRKPTRGVPPVDDDRPDYADEGPGRETLDPRLEQSLPDHGLASPPSSTHGSYFSPPSDAQGIYDELLASVSEVLTGVNIDEAADRCVTVYMQYSFPGAPICHEPTLRASVLLFFAGVSHMTPKGSTHVDFFAGNGTRARVSVMREFTLLTAVCAAMAYLMPENILPYGRCIGPAFLRAARQMLRLYEDYDYEFPTSYSLNTRVILSLALQHATGKTGVAWHVLGQARLLAQDLGLHDERSLSRYDPTEARLLRLNFWLLFTADKTAVVLNCRPITFHEVAFNSELTLLYNDDSPAKLIDIHQKHAEPPFEDRVVGGFHIIRELWSRAAIIIEGVRLQGRQWAGHAVPPGDTAALVTNLTQEYLDFSTLLDTVPPWIDSPDTALVIDEAAAQYQSTTFWILRVNIFVSFYCANMMILCNAVKYNMTAIMGLDLQPLTLAMQKTQIAYDFLRALQSIPLKHLQVGGEPLFEKIRVVGSTLLELIGEAENETIKSRAKLCFEKLLDILAQLDSKARDELNNGGRIVATT